MKYLIARFNADGSTSWLGFSKRWHLERPEAIEFRTRQEAQRYLDSQLPNYDGRRANVVRDDELV